MTHAIKAPDTAILSNRHAELRLELVARGLEVLVITRPCNIRYLTNHHGSAGVALLSQEGVHLLVDRRYAEGVRQRQVTSAACPGLELYVVEGSSGYEQAVIDHLSRISSGLAGFEADQLTVSRYEWWSAVLRRRGSRVELKGTQGIIERQRAVKDTGEIEVLREAAARLSPVAQVAFLAVRPGVSERRVARAIDVALGESGFDRPAFETIVAGGPNSALPHHHPTERLMEDGELVVLDFGGVLGGYCSDLTRTVAIGRTETAQRNLYEAVRDAQMAALAIIRPGVAAADVDAAARGVLHDRGLGEAFAHGTGHGLGLEVHEEPRIYCQRDSEPRVILESGMVFTVEPGAYVPGTGGVRIEDDVLVTETGCEILTDVPRELSTIR